jgi:hypothetical protein
MCDYIFQQTTFGGTTAEKRRTKTGDCLQDLEKYFRTFDFFVNSQSHLRLATAQQIFCTTIEAQKFFLFRQMYFC